MKSNFFKIGAIFCASFVLIFTVNGLLSLSNGAESFFTITPLKLSIRVAIAALMTFQIWNTWNKFKKDA